MNIKDGIILTGGSGSRLAPINSIFNKQLFPIHSKFLIDYPIATLKNFGVENLTVILGSNHSGQIIEYLKDGAAFELNINYIYQKEPKGISQAISLCERFITDNFAVILGDNVYEEPITLKQTDKSQIVLTKHKELERFGVASMKDGKIASIAEKPKFIDNSYDNYAITGCYLFDKKFFNYFKSTSPSGRGEFEIVDIIRLYMRDNLLDYTVINGEWVDAGTFSSMNYVSNLFYNKEKINKI
jgi:glucose-1-phosphate thymidylyltransferase